MSSSPPIRVVCAVLRDETGRVLVAQRPAHKHLGLKWEFPGGKIEPGETPANALVREIREELGCTIALERELGGFIHHYGAMAIELLAFAGRIAAGSVAPSAHEHVALRWVGLDEIDALDLAEADRPVVKRLRETGFSPG